MKLNLEGITKDCDQYTSKKITLPKFDIMQMRAKTKQHPRWVHFGAGNIFRGYIAKLAQTLLEEYGEEYGIIAVDSFDYEIIDRIYEPYDNLSLVVGLMADGNCTKDVVASVAESLKADFTDAVCKKRMLEIAVEPSLSMLSFTITEKGYQLFDLNGNLFGVVKEDIQNGPDSPKHVMAMVTAMLLARFKHGAHPISVVSMDNCSHNGEKLSEAVCYIAKEWVKLGYASEDFVRYVSDENQVAFPWSMIDKITPRPDAGICKMLREDGVEDMEPITTDKNTFIAPYVNAEIPQYLVIEDRFPNGRPCLEKAGVYFTDRDTVNCAERMKVTTCLNPLHTALAVAGCLLGYQKIADEMQDADLVKLVEMIGYQEGLPMVVSPGIIDPAAFIKEVLEERLPNPYIPDMPQRIATDTSQKVGIRFGETIKAYEKETRQGVLHAIPFAIAAWLRYLLGKDDKWADMPISSDPMLEELQKALGDITLGDKHPSLEGVRNILSNVSIFGTDLCANGMYKMIEDYFVAMIQEPGSVRAILHGLK